MRTGDEHSDAYWSLHQSPTRYVCSAIDEARNAIEKLNILTVPITRRTISSLLEEIQVHVNRMEAGLTITGDIFKLRDMQKELAREVLELESKKAKLTEDSNDDNTASSLVPDFPIAGDTFGRSY